MIVTSLIKIMNIYKVVFIMHKVFTTFSVYLLYKDISILILSYGLFTIILGCRLDFNDSFLQIFMKIS